MEQDKITVELIRTMAATTSNIIMTSHVNARCLERVIDSSDILEVLRHGEIIEDYPNDYPYPSCLLLAFPKPCMPMHVCCGVGGGKLHIITAYYPKAEKWESDMRTRKVVKK